MLTCFRRGIACNLRGKHLIYKADASWRNMALAVCLSHCIISDYLECLWKNASLPSHALFAPNLCAWTNAKLTTSGNPCTKTATLKDSRKKLRDATRHLDVRKRDENNVDLLDMWSGSRVQERKSDDRGRACARELPYGDSSPRNMHIFCRVQLSV